MFTKVRTSRKKGITSSLHGPYELGYTCATMVMTMRGKKVTFSRTLKIIRYGLFFATQEHEVGIASNRKSERCGERFTGLSTHCPSRHEIWVVWLFDGSNCRILTNRKYPWVFFWSLWKDKWFSGQKLRRSCNKVAVGEPVAVWNTREKIKRPPNLIIRGVAKGARRRFLDPLFMGSNPISSKG